MTWVYLLVLGVVATGISTVAFFYMVFKHGPLFAGMTTYVVPILALAWGQFDHETISAAAARSNGRRARHGRPRPERHHATG